MSYSSSLCIRRSFVPSGLKTDFWMSVGLFAFVYIIKHTNGALAILAAEKNAIGSGWEKTHKDGVNVKMGRPAAEGRGEESYA